VGSAMMMMAATPSKRRRRVEAIKMSKSLKNEMLSFWVPPRKLRGAAAANSPLDTL